MQDDPKKRVCPARKWTKRAGIIAFLFFLGKGLALAGRYRRRCLLHPQLIRLFRFRLWLDVVVKYDDLCSVSLIILKPDQVS